MTDDDSGQFGDYPGLSRLRAVDIPENLGVSRRLRDKLADIAEEHPDQNPLALIQQLPHMMGAFLSTVMGLEMKLNDMQKRLDDLL